jgi:hypothetical protein
VEDELLVDWELLLSVVSDHHQTRILEVQVVAQKFPLNTDSDTKVFHIFILISTYSDKDNINFTVRDDQTLNYQKREESADGGRVRGSYVVHDPDGFLRTVTYGDDGNGFYATVAREPTDLFGNRRFSTSASDEGK